MRTTSSPRVTKLYTTVIGWNDPEKALNLIKEGSDPNDPPFLLSRAIQLKKWKCAKVLIFNGANVNAYVFLSIRIHTHISSIKSTFNLHICINIVALYI